MLEKLMHRYTTKINGVDAYFSDKQKLLRDIIEKEIYVRFFVDENKILQIVTF